jgi:hypothetical protein
VADVPVESIRFTLSILAQSGAQREKFTKKHTGHGLDQTGTPGGQAGGAARPYNYPGTIAWRLSKGRDRGMYGS